MTHEQALSQALAYAEQYYVTCILAAQAEDIGDLVSRDKELDDADRKAGCIRWYRGQLAMIEARETEQLEAAE
jgi:hypothetical protein